MEDHNEKRRVSRQNWKPGRLWSVLHGVWTVAYSGIKVALAALTTVLVIAAVCCVVFVGVLAEYLEGDVLPQAGIQLEGFDLNQPSYVYYVDESGNIQVLQKLYATVDSEWAEIEEIPEAMIYAAVSIEDHRFFEHQGVDWFTTIKACAGLFMGNGGAGGSSITQQLIKNMLLTEDETANDVTVRRKILEIFRATEFEKKYDKDVVLEWYLNYIFLGNNCTGVKSAASRYFGKELEDLTAAECACIISITNNPSIFNPISDQEITYNGETRTAAQWNKWRRENTLWTMHEYGYLTDEEYEQALIDSENLEFKSGIDFADRYSDCEECGYHGHNDTFELSGSIYYCPQCTAATTIGEDASQSVYSWFVDTVINDLAQALAEEAGMETSDKVLELYRNLICNSGYHIYSTLDLEAQNAVDAIYTNVDEIPSTSSMQQLQSGIVVIDNESGDIVALSGGVGEKTVYYAYNRATSNWMQPGSSIKPLTVYAPAFELGLISPVTVVNDLPLYYSGDEEAEAAGKLSPFPRNDDRKYKYAYSILEGITKSVNAVAVNTLDTMGLEFSFDFAKYKFNLQGLYENYVNAYGTVFTDIAYAPLGMGAPTIGVSVRDMAAAYATFSNNGVWREARTFTHVYNNDGELVYYNEQDSQQILSEKTVTYISYCLNNAVNSGTGTAAKISGQNVAGKTGTTASSKDRWFCGYTGYYTAAVWCGYDTPEVISLNGATSAERQNPACQLFRKVLTPLHKGLEAVELYDDSEMVYVGVCKDCGMLATSDCASDPRGSRVTYAYCYEDDVPSGSCTCHVRVDYCTACGAPANAYCYKFAAVGKTTITSTVLCKMTQAEVDEIVKACRYGLDSSYLSNSYIYLVDESGRDALFYGYDGTANAGLSYPYVVGTTHNASSWAAYQSGHSGTTTPDPDPGTDGDNGTEPTE